MPVFVVTHNVPDAWSRDDAPFTFVTYGVERAVAQAAAVAGDGIVGVGAADIVQRCVKASPLDEIVINLAVLRGEGIRTAARWSTAARGYRSIIAVWIAGEWLIGGVALQT